MDGSMPGFPVLPYLLEFAEIHVHGVSAAIQPPPPLLAPSPFAFNLFQHWGLLFIYLFLIFIFTSEVFSSESALHFRWPKYWPLVQKISSCSFFLASPPINFCRIVSHHAGHGGVWGLMNGGGFTCVLGSFKLIESLSIIFLLWA